MRRLLLPLILVFSTLPAFSATWFVRADGGTRYSVNVTTGQCNGSSNSPYPGSGVNQNCAFNDIRYLWTDASFNADPNAGAPKWGWIGSGGDTYIVASCIQYSSPSTPIPGSSGPCSIGQNGPNSGDGFGLFGSPQQAGAPTPIPGPDAAHPTRILGANWASCTSPSAKMLVYGRYGVGGALSANTSNLDVECFEISDQSTCSRASSLSTDPCNTSFPLSDYANDGLGFNRNAVNVTVSNVYVHGTAHNCFSGSTGDNTVLTNVYGSGCPSAGWNMDPGDGTTGTGHLTLNNVNIAFSGFAEIFPINHANDFTLPWGTVGQVTDGTDQSHGGYGDCVGTATATSSPAWIMGVNGGSCAYSTQDGYDLLHLQGGGSTISLNGALSYGNMGQQMKLGAAGSITNSVLVGNCNALRTLPGLAAGANAQLGDYCRAGDAAVAMAVSDGTTTTYAFNTMYTASVIQIEVVNSCTNSTCVMKYENNILNGFANTAANGYDPAVARGSLPNPLFFDNAGDPFSFGGSTYSHNATFNQLATTPCPNTSLGEVNALCTSPQLSDMTWHLYGFGNMAPASGASAVVGAGIAFGGITTDFNGVTRPNPPSMGAIEFAAGTPTVAQPTASPVAGTYTSTQTVTLSTVTGGASIVYTTDGSTPTVTALTCTITHGTLYSGPLTVSTTQTINAIGCLASDNASSMFSGLYTITPPPTPTVTMNNVKLSGSVTIK